MAERTRSVWGVALRHDLRLVRRGVFAWTVVFAASFAAVVNAYETAYPTQVGREGIAKLLEGNQAFEALFGLVRGIDTVGGFTAWRVGGPLAIIAGIWGLLAATRVLRGEEEAGRCELVVSGALTKAGATMAALAALGIGFAFVWVVLVGALVGLGLAVGSSAVLALGTVGAAAVFSGVGALASQLVPVRRRAAGLTGGALGAAVLLRVVADGTANLGWLRALTPFGWIEDLRPFSGSDLPWLVPLAAAAAVLVLATVRAAAGRDLGAGALWSGETGRSSARMLGSELGFTTRSSIMPTAVWTVSIAAFGAVLGLLSVEAAEFAARSPGFRRIAGRIGGIDIGSAKGFIGYAFSMMVVPVCLFVAFRMQAAREEEATGRLDNVLTRAVGRRGWMLSQVGVAAAGAAVMAVGIAVATWAAASSRGAGVELGGMLLAAANWLPVVLLFLGIGVLAFAAVPRAAPALTLGAVAVGFLLQLVGMLTKMPRAVLDLSPFHHVAASPAVGVNTGAAAVMLAIGAACAAAGTEVFARRDLAGA